MRSLVDMVLDSVEWSDCPKLTPEEAKPGMLYAVREGVLRIGDGELKCFVLNDGSRVFEQQSVLDFLGLAVADKEPR